MSRVPAPLLVLAAVVSVQVGGAYAVTLLPFVGVAGSVALRLVIAAGVLLAVARPRLTGRSAADWRTVAAFGLVLAAMNLCFYGSLARLPLGVAVTIEFIGPLTLAAALSRKVADLVAVLVAAAGVVLISGVLHEPWAEVDLVGLGLAAAAGALWAAYIILSGRTGRRFAQLEGLALAMAIGTVVVLPVGVAQAGAALLVPATIALATGVALMSSVVPYSLELLALRRMSARVFGVLLSLEPAAAALAGLIVLDQRLSGWQLLGMACVVGASLAVIGRRGSPTPATDGPSPA